MLRVNRSMGGEWMIMIMHACSGEDGNFSTRYGDKSNLSFIGPICLHCFFFTC